MARDRLYHQSNDDSQALKYNKAITRVEYRSQTRDLQLEKII